MDEMLLKMKNIHKYFPGNHVLDGVDFDLTAGEVHALLGENGAGKSTLIKLLGGIYRKDGGEILVNGKSVEINRISDAKKLGIYIIHQELVLVPHMTVAENIFLGREFTGAMKFVDQHAMNREARKLLDEYEVNVEPSAIVSTLTIAHQQMIEIIRAMSNNTKILVMDEPTSSLDESEVQAMFKSIRDLRAQGVGIIYISHRMSELFEIADRVTVLRDGKYIGTKAIKETSTDDLVAMMVGRKLTSYYTRTYNHAGKSDTVLEVRGLSRKNVFQDVSFSVRKGEILGFSGLIGAGRSEVMRGIFGIDRLDGGEVLVNGKKISVRAPKDALAHGIAFVPENRKEEGLFLNETVRFNITFKVLGKFIKGISLNRRVEHGIAEEFIKSLSIKVKSQSQNIFHLSGGNQQKVVIAKWLAMSPQLLILDEPTRGVDIAAKAEIYTIMNQLAAQGVAIIMISSELPEIINMSDRVVVMSGGRISGCLEKDELSQEKIMQYAIGGMQ